MTQGHSLLIIGASGAGKSSTLRDALRYEGSGVMLLAPGGDERSSYVEFEGREGYYLKGFDDPEFLPTIGSWETIGFAQCVATANNLRKKVAEALEAGESLPYKVLGIDTMDGMAQLAVNIMLKRGTMQEAPKARSTEGFSYYTGIQNLMNQLMRPLRACRDLGMHLIVAVHAADREVTSAASAEIVGKTARMPLIPGSFKEQLPGIFDLVVAAGVDREGEIVGGANDPNHPRHYVEWMPNIKQPSKSRLGALATMGRLPNEWSVLRPLMDAALAARCTIADSEEREPSQSDLKESSQ